MPYSPRPIPVSSADAHSVSATGLATAPGAGAALATIAAGSLPVGRYRVCVQALYAAGTPAAAEDTNVQIRRAAVEVKRLAMGRTAGTGRTAVIVVELDGAQALSVNAVAAATAAVVYVASITATKIR